jgi:hypothetical protein
MATKYPKLQTSCEFPGMNLPAHRPSGTEDDDDDRDDEHANENEAPVRAVDEGTETPEEFEIDDKEELNHPEDDDAGEDKEDDEEEIAALLRAASPEEWNAIIADAKRQGEAAAAKAAEKAAKKAPKQPAGP